ncbi:uncharacterized protein LOC135208961 [Macrobrachium nipponense]|uniref:uncharacterized protein LOC135208961 n=1 Tax=Macrobrachium nipponense TaxID=159736 RepID=UPI0030C7BADF
MAAINESKNEKEVVLDFIHAYRAHPASWKVKSKGYSNKVARNKGIAALHEILKELEPDCTRDALTKKINSLRASFRREHKKIESSKTSGTSADDIYATSLWFSDEMMFVLDQDVARESCSNLGDIDNINDENEEGDETENAKPSTSQQGRPRKRFSKSDQILDTVARKLDESVNTDMSGMDSFGKYVTRRILAMDQRTSIITRKIIHDVLFEAEMGNLNSSSRVVTTHQEPVPLPNAFK